MDVNERILYVVYMRNFYNWNYYGMYKLSKYFQILSSTCKYDEVLRLKMCEDLYLSIEKLIYSERE